MIDPRTPVLVGVGTSYDDVEAVELMCRAALAAGHDAGANALLPAVERIAVPRGTWSYTDPGRIVAERIGAHPKTHLVDLGIPQQTLVNQALRAIIDGALDVALVVGAEAKARAARLAKRSQAANAAGIIDVVRRGGGDANEIDQGGATPDVHQVPEGEILSASEIEARLFAPVEQYALMESARRFDAGTTVAEHCADIAALWARFNAVARTNPDAAFPIEIDERTLRELGPDHRPLAFPYGKWHASQWTVDQGAALLLCSAEAATRYGVDPNRWLFPVVGIESSWSVALPKRRDIHRWPAMRVLGEVASTHLGRDVAALDAAELYSCFPLAVRVQQRELGFATESTPTITGGMTFAGGPFNSFVLQATAAMANRLRAEPGTALVTTVSGMLTKPGLAVLSSEPGRRPPLVADLADEARAATATLDVDPAYDGPATVAGYTVTYEGVAPKEIVALFDVSPAARVIARSTSAALLERAVTEELVGETFTVSGTTFD